MCWNNPFRDRRPAGWVFEAEGQIAGHLGVVCLPLRSAKTRILGLVGVDYAIDPEAKLDGLAFAGLQLAKALFDEGQDCAVLATTANDKTGAVFQRFGSIPVDWTKELWMAPATREQLVRTLLGGRNRILRRMHGSVLGRPFLRSYLSLSGQRRMPRVQLAAGWRLDIRELDSSLDHVSLWNELTGLSGRGDGCKAEADSAICFSVDHDIDFYTWRYDSHPDRSLIRVIQLRDSGGLLLGAAIVQLPELQQSDRAYIEALISAGDRRDVLYSLFSAALRLAYQDGAAALVTTAGCQAYRPMFWEMGFTSCARSGPAFVIKLPESLAVDASTLSGNLLFWHGAMF
jgi:hypothetical protein